MKKNFSVSSCDCEGGAEGVATLKIALSTLISDQSPSELAFSHIEDTFYMYYNSAQSINNCFILNAYERK